MDLVELRIAGALVNLRSGRGVIGPVAIRAPVPFVRASHCIEHDHAPVAVAVGHEQLVRAWIDRHVGGLAEILGIVAAVPLPRRPICSRNLPLASNFRIWFSLVPAAPRPAIQTLF